jgi:hypothetical protein
VLNRGSFFVIGLALLGHACSGGSGAQPSGTGGSGKTTDTKASPDAADAKELPGFNVQSVKVLSTTCS